MNQRAEQLVAILVVAVLLAVLHGVEAYGYRFRLALLGAEAVIVERAP